MHFVGNHTIATVRGKESYALFSEAFKELFKEINSLHNKGTVTADGMTYKVDIYFAADYKVNVLTYHVKIPYNIYFMFS